jgi:hypothetical protein
MYHMPVYVNCTVNCITAVINYYYHTVFIILQLPLKANYQTLGYLKNSYAELIC